MGDKIDNLEENPVLCILNAHLNSLSACIRCYNKELIELEDAIKRINKKRRDCLDDKKKIEESISVLENRLNYVL